ncbi:MAG: hypothetical protein AB1832_02210 [Pseudomonadota bacterium]
MNGSLIRTTLTVLCLMAPIVSAQTNPGTTPVVPQPLPPPTVTERPQDANYWQNNYSVQAAKMQEDYAKIRTHLSESWKRLGLTPAAADMVAKTYVMQPKSLLPAVGDKSDQEIAAMMQDALTKKQYLLANQLLLQYERKKLHIPIDSQR